MPLHDANYKHWQGDHLSIWSRRRVIASNAVRAVFQGKWMRNIAVLCWGFALVQIGILFCIGQLLVADSVVMQWVDGMRSPAIKSLVGSFVTWIELHPEISVRCTQNLLFYFFANNLLIFAFIAIALAIPHLVTRDLASNAIIVYASKAVSRFDYVLGKFMGLFAILCVVWIGPMFVAWLVGNLLSPKWHFFWHSRWALINVLLYTISGSFILSLIGIGISSLASKERATVSIWIMWWVLGGALVGIVRESAASWLRYLSLKFDLNELALAIFRIDKDFVLAKDNVPFLGQFIGSFERQNFYLLQVPHPAGAVVALLLLIGIAAWVISKRVKPE